MTQRPAARLLELRKNLLFFENCVKVPSGAHEKSPACRGRVRVEWGFNAVAARLRRMNNPRGQVRAAPLTGHILVAEWHKCPARSRSLRVERFAFFRRCRPNVKRPRVQKSLRLRVADAPYSANSIGRGSSVVFNFVLAEIRLQNTALSGLAVVMSAQNKIANAIPSISEQSAAAECDVQFHSPAINVLTPESDPSAGRKSGVRFARGFIFPGSYGHSEILSKLAPTPRRKHIIRTSIFELLNNFARVCRTVVASHFYFDVIPANMPAWLLMPSPPKATPTR